MCIRSILAYRFEVCAKTYINKTQAVQNKNLKIIYNLPRRLSTHILQKFQD